MKYKICTKCSKSYSATIEFFPLHKQTVDGLDSWCRMCHRKAKTKWQQQHPEEAKKYNEKYYQTLKGYLRYVFYNIKQRCNNPRHKQYKDYGGRGIKLEFTHQELISWCVKNNVDPRGLQIDRIDNNGNYSLDNIRFVTAKINSNNRRKKHDRKT